MRWNKRSFISSIIILVVFTFLFGYPLPYYIYKPGGADALNPVVEVSGSYESQGDMHLVTVRGGQATPIQYLLAKIRSFHDIEDIDDVFPEGITSDDYHQIQLQMMENSQQASTVVAYQAANKDIEIEFEGVYVVAAIEGMPAFGILKSGDKILTIDEHPVSSTDELIDYVSVKDPGTVLEVEIERDDQKLTKEVGLQLFPDDNKVGMGIQLVTNRIVKVDPEVEFASGNIGGPSAGLMFSLEIYDQLTEEDITKGYQIAGTGEINYEGQVGRIGSVDKKVVAADKEGCDIFFAPNEGGADGSNYQVALDAANQINSDMKIVPVDTFEDALNYLENLEPKQ